MSKKVSIAAKPSANRETSAEADKWVESRKTMSAPAERMKRLTIDVPESLHRRLKMSCAGRGVKMADEIRIALETLCQADA
jgi:hypothetical protein